jgi:hypothetical protein
MSKQTRRPHQSQQTRQAYQARAYEPYRAAVGL